ncbi:hypothetical protein CP532_3752 [Ophiocordyceps camponoti-leonardi (nom. inval.)]|nr:hypothetical protein CP532_3752 [Ophiocordyceps camponoti-leonardi (nom. inval.)]
MATEPDSKLILPIIDAHVHLWPGDQVRSLRWCDATSSPHLARQRSVREYLRSTTSAMPRSQLLGFIAIEADRVHSDENDWDSPLEEISFFSRVAVGRPREGEEEEEEEEGNSPAEAPLCLAFIPWAPMTGGASTLERYLKKAREAAGEEAWPKVRGFRYLLQDKPHGIMLEPAFIESLKLLGKRGFVFEVAVDQHRRGKRQLEELVEMVGRAHEGVPDDERVTFILNHLCKPDLTIYNLSSDPSFHAWRTAMYALSKAPRTYVKLSGAFSEMTPQLRSEPAPQIFRSMFAWLGILIATFGPGRIIFASDWPICQQLRHVKGGVDGAQAAAAADDDDDDDDDDDVDSWSKWRDVVEKMCWMATLDDVDRAMIFGGTAKKAYNL